MQMGLKTKFSKQIKTFLRNANNFDSKIMLKYSINFDLAEVRLIKFLLIHA